MTVGFSGDVAEYYAKYRRGYPEQALDALQETFALTRDDLVLDLGCGTGQLAVPLAARVRAVLGLDPEPDMLRLARATAAEQDVHNVSWLLGADTDVPALGTALGPRVLGAAVIGQAVHWMRHEELFRALSPLIRPGGGVAVLANGTPLWLQDTDWSRSLRDCLEAYFRQPLRATCGTGDQDRLDYARGLRDAGFTGVRELAVEYEDRLGVEQLVGTVFSAIPAEDLPAPPDRPALAARIRAALPDVHHVTETVRVSLVLGRAPHPVSPDNAAGAPPGERPARTFPAAQA
ncbi:class I SAM-dependent methyltransferase [Streptomyces sp. RKND-216]|uniref:class I SAM-dependent methyltransferase n=1 Tax=Streptomyces sp. RKND-216 TaxID=2562581 RepID=UPI00109E2212|nr:class I SAM-dependent methyltransferase [Streptomyces sp. RKND-216]THA24388.1 class I SAM-dependent methyltransferase [Streptomyces sp. RKND-216]